MNKIIEITKEQFGNFVVFAKGMYHLENDKDSLESFQASLKPLRFFIATYGGKAGQWTDCLIIIDPVMLENNSVICSCDWWVLDCSRDTTDWPEVPTEATHMLKGKWCGVKWFTMEYCTGYDGEDFVEEMTRDMQLLREVIKLCGANEWDT